MKNSFSLLFWFVCLRMPLFDVIVFWLQSGFCISRKWLYFNFHDLHSGLKPQQVDSVQLRSQMEYSNATEFIYSYWCMSCYCLVKKGQNSKNAFNAFFEFQWILSCLSSFSETWDILEDYETPPWRRESFSITAVSLPVSLSLSCQSGCNESFDRMPLLIHPYISLY